jgi:predicted nucleic acid-binding protein
LIVLDSSLLVAYYNRRDVHHAAAAETMRAIAAETWGRALLLEYVFAETTTVLLARRGLRAATSVGTGLLEARELDFVPCSQLFDDAFEVFRRQHRRSLSFTDAAIVAATRRYEASHLATFDADFRGLAGIVVVPS